MQKDEYGTVQNSQETYHDIASLLDTYHACIFPWSDEEGTQFDILFSILPASMQAVSRQLIQGGIRSNDLFVSIMRVGCFAFEVGNTDTHPAYYAEKLRLPPGGGTTQKLAQLINGVKAELINIRSQARPL